MRILLVNDDGIDAIGLQKLYEMVSSYDFISDIWIVAPEEDKSCCSHSMTFEKDIAVYKKANKRFAVAGTPVDCVVIAINDLMKNYRPDFIISGINEGANVDVDITYSGTVAAAREGALSGISSIAISQMYKKGDRSLHEVNWQHKNAIFYELLRKFLYLYKDKNIFRERTLLNINLPFTEIIGTKYIQQGKHYFGNRVEKVEAEKNRKVYVIGTNKIKINSLDLTNGYITIMPIGVNVTDYSLLSYLERVES